MGVVLSVCAAPARMQQWAYGGVGVWGCFPEPGLGHALAGEVMSLKSTHVPLSGRGEVPRRIIYAQSLCPNVYTAGADEGVGSKVRNHSYGETPVGK